MYLKPPQAKEILELIKEYLGDNGYLNILEVAEDILYKDSEILRLSSENKILKQEICELKDKLRDAEAAKIQARDLADRMFIRADEIKDKLKDTLK